MTKSKSKDPNNSSVENSVEDLNEKAMLANAQKNVQFANIQENDDGGSVGNATVDEADVENAVENEDEDAKSDDTEEKIRK